MTSLGFYDVQNAATATALDLGTIAPKSSDDSMLRVVNNSDLYQAEDVILAVTGSDAIQLWLSNDGDTFSSSIDIGDIAPGGISGIFWLRRVTPSYTGAGARHATVVATPTSWSNPVDTSTSDNVPLSTED